MDRRTIRPFPSAGFVRREDLPEGAMVWTSNQGQVIDYVEVVKTTDKVVAGKDAPADALLVVVKDAATIPEYVKAPPQGFVFRHDFAGLQVSANPGAESVTPVDPALVPIDVKP